VKSLRRSFRRYGTTQISDIFESACSQVPTEGEGSAQGMVDDPVATAASNNPLLTTLTKAVNAANLGDTPPHRTWPHQTEERHCVRHRSGALTAGHLARQVAHRHPQQAQGIVRDGSRIAPAVPAAYHDSREIATLFLRSQAATVDACQGKP